MNVNKPQDYHKIHSYFAMLRKIKNVVPLILGFFCAPGKYFVQFYFDIGPDKETDKQTETKKFCIPGVIRNIIKTVKCKNETKENERGREIEYPVNRCSKMIYIHSASPLLGYINCCTDLAQ